MNKVFIIQENPTGYDEVEVIVGYVTSEEEAEKLCNKLNEFYKQLVDLSNGVNEEVDKIDMSDLSFEEMVPLPKWAKGLAATEISDDMRAERDAILAENEAIKERNGVKIKERSRRIADTVAAHVGGLNGSDELKEYVRDRIGYHGSVKTYLQLYTYTEIKKLS